MIQTGIIGRGNGAMEIEEVEFGKLHCINNSRIGFVAEGCFSGFGIEISFPMGMEYGVDFVGKETFCSMILCVPQVWTPCSSDYQALRGRLINNLKGKGA